MYTIYLYFKIYKMKKKKQYVYENAVLFFLC